MFLFLLLSLLSGVLEIGVILRVYATGKPMWEILLMGSMYQMVSAPGTGYLECMPGPCESVLGQFCDPGASSGIVLSWHPGSEGVAKGLLPNLAEAYVSHRGIPSGTAYDHNSPGNDAFMCDSPFGGCNGKPGGQGRGRGSYIRENHITGRRIKGNHTGGNRIKGNNTGGSHITEGHNRKRGVGDDDFSPDALFCVHL